MPQCGESRLNPGPKLPNIAAPEHAGVSMQEEKKKFKNV